MGTMIQSYKLEEQDFRGEQFRLTSRDQKGNIDLLNLTKPEIIRDIHRKYLDAGADIIETNTFSANSISQADYGMEEYVYRINFEGAKIASSCASEYTAKNQNKPRFVAGSIGPTNKTASLSSRVEDPGYRDVSFDDFVKIYGEQAIGLIEGGVDILLIETVSYLVTHNNCHCIKFIILFHHIQFLFNILAALNLITNSGRVLISQHRIG